MRRQALDDQIRLACAGDAWPNKMEFIARHGPWRHCGAVELATLHWVHWYNHRRLFEPLGHVPPAEFEAHYDHPPQESAMAA